MRAHRNEYAQSEKELIIRDARRMGILQTEITGIRFQPSRTGIKESTIGID